jgi:hypothetical protein
MATKVCKLKDGNEIIADIKEIRNKEDEPIAYLLTSPYRVEHYLDEDDYFGREEIEEDDPGEDGDDGFDSDEVVDTKDLVAEPDGSLSLDMGRMDTGIPDEPFQLDKLRLQFYPWFPLAKDNRIHIPLDFLVTAYDAHPEVEQKYKDLIDRMIELQEADELDEIDGDDDEEVINPEVMLDEEESDE